MYSAYSKLTLSIAKLLSESLNFLYLVNKRKLPVYRYTKILLKVKTLLIKFVIFFFFSLNTFFANNILKDITPSKL